MHVFQSIRILGGDYPLVVFVLAGMIVYGLVIALIRVRQANRRHPSPNKPSTLLDLTDQPVIRKQPRNTERSLPTASYINDAAPPKDSTTVPGEFVPHQHEVRRKVVQIAFGKSPKDESKEKGLTTPADRAQENQPDEGS